MSMRGRAQSDGLASQYQQRLRRDPTNPELHFLLAKEQHRQLNLFDAVDTMAKAVSLDPSQDKWQYLGRLLQEAAVANAAREAYALSSFLQRFNIGFEDLEGQSATESEDESEEPPTPVQPGARLKRANSSGSNTISRIVSSTTTVHSNSLVIQQASPLPEQQMDASKKSRKFFFFRKDKKPKPKAPSPKALNRNQAKEVESGSSRWGRLTRPFAPRSPSSSSSQSTSKIQFATQQSQCRMELACAICRCAIGHAHRHASPFSCMICHRILCRNDFVASLSICVECDLAQDDDDAESDEEFESLSDAASDVARDVSNEHIPAVVAGVEPDFCLDLENELQMSAHSSVELDDSALGRNSSNDNQDCDVATPVPHQALETVTERRQSSSSVLEFSLTPEQRASFEACATPTAPAGDGFFLVPTDDECDAALFQISPIHRMESLNSLKADSTDEESIAVLEREHAQPTKLLSKFLRRKSFVQDWQRQVLCS